MKASNTASPASVDQYLNTFTSPVRNTLEKVRKTIKAAAPEAEELISYQMPAYKYHGMLVYFAGWKNHIGFYPASRAIKIFKKELSVYEGAKGSVKFPIDEPIPFGLISKIVKFRVKENEEKATAKNNKTAAGASTPKKSSDEEQVSLYLNKLEPSVRDEINAVRKIINDAAPQLNERIKWNAPSYYYKDDILTFGPYKTGKILLVFHHPFVIKIESELLEGNYKDRRLVYFKNKTEAKKHKKELSGIINGIMKLIDKK
ncbi:MAG: DUF1801 domain-containing protein [Ginsengibacter sp.]